MSDIDITPEIIRAVRDQLFEPLDHVHAVLTTAAADLEREQADENRIDELARIFYEAEIECFGASDYPEYSDRRPEYQEGTRAGVRAVLDKLRIDSYTSPCDGKCGDISPHNGHLTPEGRRHFLAEPRTWAQIEDVPGDVGVVMNAYRDRIRRDPETAYGWRFIWDGGGDRAPVPRGSLAEHGPYTEVIADV